MLKMWLRERNKRKLMKVLNKKQEIVKAPIYVEEIDNENYN